MNDERQSWHDEHLEIVEQLREIRRHQHTIHHELQGIRMAIPQAVTDVLAALDKATADIEAQIGTGMTQAEVDQVVARVKADSDKLETLVAPPTPTP